MKISVIMNCYNSDAYLKEAIDSVYVQTYKNWEIIFWDNQSSDNSAEIAKSYDNKLRYFCSNEYLRLGDGRNKALEQASGDLIAFLDCDDQWLPEKLEKQVAVFNENNDVMLVFSNFFRYNQEKKSQRVAIKNNVLSGYIFKESIEKYPVGMLTAVIRKNVLDQLDYWFDPKLNLVVDYDFFMRIILRNKVTYLSEILAIYRVHSNNHTSLYNADFPDELIYTLENFKRLDMKKKYYQLIETEIKRQKTIKAFRQLLCKHRYICYLIYLYKNKLISSKLILSDFFRYFKLNIKSIINKMSS